MELEFGLAKCTTVQVRLQYLFHLEKIKKQNAFPCKFRKNFKGPSFHCQKCLDEKYLWLSRTI